MVTEEFRCDNTVICHTQRLYGGGKGMHVYTIKIKDGMVDQWSSVQKSDFHHLHGTMFHMDLNSERYLAIYLNICNLCMLSSIPPLYYIRFNFNTRHFDYFFLHRESGLQLSLSIFFPLNPIPSQAQTLRDEP